MTPPIVAVLALGDMGHAVGRVLIDHGVRSRMSAGNRTSV